MMLIVQVPSEFCGLLFFYLRVFSTMFDLASTGSVRQYAPDKSALVWKIKQLEGSREFLMRVHFGLRPSVKSGAFYFYFCDLICL